MDVVLGTAQLTRRYGIAENSEVPLQKEDSQKLIALAQRLGLKGIDTAPVYGDAESVIGLAGTSLPVQTKFNPALNEEDSVRESLRRLRRDSIEVVYFHERLDPQHFGTRVPELRAKLSPLTVTHLGVSVYGVDECVAALDCEAITAIQCPFNVFDRRFSSVFFADFLKRGGKVFVRSIFLQGLLLARPDRVPVHLVGLIPFLRNFWAVCREWEVSPLIAAMLFANQSLPFGGLIVGTRSPLELNQVVEATAVLLDQEFLEVLEGLPQPSWDMVDPRQW